MPRWLGGLGTRAIWGGPELLHLFPRHIQVRLGEHNISMSSGYEQFSMVQEAIIHPGFVDGTSGLRSYENDIMLLRLNPPAVYTSYVQPTDLPTLCPLPTGTTCTVMGWGTTSSPEGNSRALRGLRKESWGLWVRMRGTKGERVFGLRMRGTRRAVWGRGR